MDGVKKIRLNAVRAVELMTNAPVGAVESWLKDVFPHNVLFGVRYGKKYLHYLVVPIVDGRLNARKLFGGREACTDFQTKFWETAGKPGNMSRIDRRNKEACDELIQAMNKVMEDSVMPVPKGDEHDGKAETGGTEGTGTSRTC